MVKSIWVPKRQVVFTWETWDNYLIAQTRAHLIFPPPCNSPFAIAAAALGDTQKQVSQFPVRHCERSEAIQGPQHDRLDCCRPACCGPWIASSQGLLAMTDGSPLTRSLR